MIKSLEIEHKEAESVEVRAEDGRRKALVVANLTRGVRLPLHFSMNSSMPEQFSQCITCPDHPVQDALNPRTYVYHIQILKGPNMQHAQKMPTACT